MQKLNLHAEMAVKNDFWQKVSDDLTVPLGSKISLKLLRLTPFRDKCVLRFKMAAKNGRKIIFDKNGMIS